MALTTLATAPDTPVTTYVTTDPPTSIVTYPNPYAPSYDTIASLADDSTFIVVGPIGSETSIHTYPIYVTDDLGSNPIRVSLGISDEEFQTAKLSVGGTYVFFYGVDPSDGHSCIVGGVRGVFGFDPSTETVTRIDTNASSAIPKVQTLSALENSIEQAESAVEGSPVVNVPPLCDSSATGL
ncbi:MAG: hypothetical protein ACRDY1_05285 [Acidimicrobiales bacterium]